MKQIKIAAFLSAALVAGTSFAADILLENEGFKLTVGEDAKGAATIVRTMIVSYVGGSKMKNQRCAL